MILEPEPSLHVPSANWRLGEVGGCDSAQVQGLRTRGTNIQGQEKEDVSAQAKSTTAFSPFSSIETLDIVENAQLLQHG